MSDDSIDLTSFRDVLLLTPLLAIPYNFQFIILFT